MAKDNINSFRNRTESTIEEVWKMHGRINRLEHQVKSLLLTLHKVSRVLECAGSDIDPNVTSFTPKEIAAMSAEEYKEKVLPDFGVQ